MRKRARVDANQPSLVKELRDLGYSVAITAQIGSGFPDLVVGKYGKNWLLEVKDPAQPPSGRKLTIDEAAWHVEWKGQVAVVETVEDVLELTKC